MAVVSRSIWKVIVVECCQRLFQIYIVIIHTVAILVRILFQHNNSTNQVQGLTLHIGNSNRFYMRRKQSYLVEFLQLVHSYTNIANCSRKTRISSNRKVFPSSNIISMFDRHINIRVIVDVGLGIVE